MKRAIAVFCAVLLAVCLAFSASAESDNLLKNGGFEIVSDSGIPENWYPTAFHIAAVRLCADKRLYHILCGRQ